MTSKRRKEIRKRRKAKSKNKFILWYKKLSKKKKALLITGVVMLCLLLALIIYVASIFGKLNTEKIDKDDIIVNEDLDETVGVGYTNFVLFGGDSRSGEVKKNLNTDSIIIVSLNNETKEVKMVSVYRDTLLDLTNGKIKKCNSAYSTGGATMAINMLNMNLDLDIQKYVTVDFGAVVDLVDMVGGIEVDVSEKEYKEVNKYIDETGRVAGKKAKHLTHGGVQTLDGVQATTYARIRKNVGDDYARTERQRLVIQKVVEKAMKSDFATINKIIDKLFPRIATNFTLTEILSYAKDFTKYKFGETTGFPFKKGSGSIPGKGDSVFPITLKSNVSELHKFLYGTEDYQPSSKVVKISGEIATIVGNRKADTTTSNTTGNGTGGGSTTGNDTGNNNTTAKPDDSDVTTKPEDNDTATTPDDDEPNTTPGDNGTTTLPGNGEGTGDGSGEGGNTTGGEGTEGGSNEGGNTTGGGSAGGSTSGGGGSNEGSNTTGGGTTGGATDNTGNNTQGGTSTTP